ncbi:MAG: SdpI family protein [Nanoarchaeota archaeon]
MRFVIAAAILIVAMFVITFALYPMLPDKMATHWGLEGKVNGYSSKSFGAFLTPVIGVFAFLALILLPKLDPLKKNVEEFIGAYHLFIFVFSAFFFYIQVLILASNLGYGFSFTFALGPAFAILFYCAGMLLEQTKQNWFIGVRTPWTLSNPEVWDKTNKHAAKLFKIGGLAFGLVMVFLPKALIVVLALMMIGVVWIVFYSYLMLKKEKN